MNTHENLNRQVNLCISDDGYIRLSLSALESVQLRHLDSGLYDDGVPLASNFDKACSILGYTEWITDTEPAISIGWDWTVEYFDSPPRYKMVGYPFSNIVLRDHSNQDMEEDATLHHIAAFISRMNWKDELRSLITNKYS